MLLACPVSLEIGDVLQLGFSLPKEEGLIEVTALVKRVDVERNAGVVFTRVNSEDQHRISIFIDAMESHSPARVPMARAR
ncbi:MAG TPA: hypothetical protein VN872_11700, partial [Candidatus Acidoferrum sp.]|nr:hypothetical protein [Candidatus Acidoferrum sp.]